MRYHEPRQRDGGFDFIKRKATSHPAKHTEQNMVYEQREILKEKHRERERELSIRMHTLHVTHDVVNARECKWIPRTGCLI